MPSIATRRQFTGRPTADRRPPTACYVTDDVTLPRAGPQMSKSRWAAKPLGWLAKGPSA